MLASVSLQQDYGVRVGSVLRVPFYSPSQAAAVLNSTGAAPNRGPVLSSRVVGFEAAEFEFPSGSSPTYDLYATQAFGRDVLPRTAVSYTYFVRLRHGAADVPQFYGEVKALQKGAPGVEGASNQDNLAASVAASIHPQAMGWWAMAALAALVGLAVIGQALFRQSAVESEDFPTLAAMGADRRLLVALGMARALAVGLAGAVVAVMLATALSPLAPLGEARTAELSTGVTFDAFVFLSGALATVGVVLALGLWPALRAAHALRPDDRGGVSRPSRVVALVVGLRAPPSALIGVRHALERGSGDGAVPVGSAVLGTVLAVMALCGTGVFGASLSNLTSTPRLYGAAYQLSFPTMNEVSPGWGRLVNRLQHDRDITGVTQGTAGEVSIDKLTVGAVVATVFRGRFLFPTVRGRLPQGGGQVGLGAETMRQIGAHIGSVVEVVLGRSAVGAVRVVPFKVVSQVSFPVFGSGTVSLGSGALLTRAGFEDARCPPGPRHAACVKAVTGQLNSGGGGLLVSFVPGPAGRADIKRYLSSYQSIAAFPAAPTSLINFGEAVNFPLIFGAILVVFGAATLAHLLVVSVSRRRREIALLKVLGFVRTQVGSVVAWQATTLALVGAVIGVPLGVVIGREVWRVFANNLGAIPVAVVPVWLLVALVGGALLVANAIAVTPALLAARSKPGLLLRGQ